MGVAVISHPDIQQHCSIVFLRNDMIIEDLLVKCTWFLDRPHFPRKNRISFSVADVLV